MVSQWKIEYFPSFLNYNGMGTKRSTAKKKTSIINPHFELGMLLALQQKH
jgi:hypothetical protein